MDSSDELGRRDRKKLETRAALERAALRLVAERGLADVTVEDIAGAVDVSSRTFFNYFPTKEDALIGGDPAAAADLRRKLVAVPSAVPTLEALRLVLRDAAVSIQEQREQWLLRLGVFEQNPSLLPRLVAGGAETERSLTAAVAERLGTGPASQQPGAEQPASPQPDAATSHQPAAGRLGDGPAAAGRAGADPVADGHAELVTAVALTAFRVAMMRWSAARGGPLLADLLDDVFSRLSAGLPDPRPPAP
ncbi:TetR family transcriptional regulator [Planomonospora parontospora]|uniref:TetR family transcriptional regulator n=1 Tax=Planomonospora parontospora TaxID=58119 RepID=UPI0016705D84|nr:TetR family transcriptional regulator [Planomonospora parontospora]GGL50297.1 TetR family transcriptional regulator [Planomonospora parontospora subsp. antibiotica]GII18971.1 TetR family transcriptional regulator [Planomonospora parontospora subsp. antibiotica]